MEQILLWFFEKFSYLVRSALSWHILGDFSLLHFILGAVLLTIILELISFGSLNAGGTADYVGGIRRTRNNENARDRERYASKTYETRYHNTGVVSNRTTRRIRE